VFDSEGNEVNAIPGFKFEPGTTYRLAVAGSASGGAFTMARFIINGVTQPETTQIRPGTTNEYYFDYTVPENATSISINAQLFHNSLGWF
jgi:hypothetical protein